MAKVKLKNKFKMAMGYVLIGLSLILFILSCIPNFAVANFFKGVFGIAGYSYLIFGILFGIANILELKYAYSRRFTAFLCLTVFSLIAILHIIFSHSALVAFEGFNNFGNYINECYNLSNGITVGGVVFGSIAYCFKTLFGIVGVYAIFIMMMAISGGIVIDALIYGTAKKSKRNIQTTQADVPNVNNAEVETPSIDVNTDKSLPIKDENEEDYGYEFNAISSKDSQIKQQAKETLFPERDFTTNQTSTLSRNQSARDILFSQRDIPDITMANDAQRDRWMRNAAKELGDEPSLIFDDDTEDIFGNTSIDNVSNDTSDLYTRGFGTFNGINTQDDDQEDMSTLRGSSIRNSRINRFTEDSDRLANRRMQNSRTFDSRDIFGNSEFNKLGEDDDDIAKPQNIDFGLNSPAPTPSRSSRVSGKQIGIKAVRYNSIPLSIFKTYEETNADYSEEYRRKSASIENVMRNFNIGAKVINVVRGPKVTRYELSLPDGVPVTKVLALEKNIAMALAARSAIRIEAPIPGKNAFGIELENDVSSTVGMKELLENPEFVNCKHPLPIAIGKNINGQVIIKSLPKMIHLLVAGSSGSGKSVFIHTLLMSILYKYSPNDVRFIMIDPKRVEFTMYENLPHLMFPNVIDEHDKALKVLNWTVNEMENRYKLLKSTTSQNIEQYNKTADVVSGKEQKMTYLIIVVDELAELMGSPLKKDFEAAIQRITQLGRAAGIHMVLATQRPSVDVVNGTIKNNLPSRVAFALASAVDSKTVIDIGGAEKLLGQGDMLFAPQDQNVKIRLQAAFCDNDEIRNAINYIKENNETDFDEELMEQIFADKKETPMEGTDALGNGGGSVSDNSMDDLMKPVVKYARSIGKISSSMLQRKFRIGFNRAARIVFELEELGFVGPQVGAKPRDFVMTDEQYVELFGEDDDDDSIF